MGEAQEASLCKLQAPPLYLQTSPGVLMGQDSPSPLGIRSYLLFNGLSNHQIQSHQLTSLITWNPLNISYLIQSTPFNHLMCVTFQAHPKLAVCNKLNSHQLNELIIIIIDSFTHRSWIVSIYYAMTPKRCRVLKPMDLSAYRYHVTLVPHPLVIRIPYIWYGQGVRPIWNPNKSCSLSESRGELFLSLSDQPQLRISRSTTSWNTNSQ